MAISAALRASRRQARAIRGEPVDQLAEARIALVALGFERRGVRQRRLARARSAAARREIRGERFQFAAHVVERAQLFGEEFVRPGGAQLQAVQHVDDAEGLAAREIALDMRDDFFAQRRDHAVDQAGQGIVHAARSSILAI